MDEKSFIKKYLNRYNKSLFETDVSDKLIKMKKILFEARDVGRKVIIAGNGGSAAMASHVAVDFTKQGKVRTINFNEPDLITCFANDYGYENWISKAIEYYGECVTNTQRCTVDWQKDVKTKPCARELWH